MGTALFVLLWWLALFGWWIVLVGTNAGLELIAGACAALLGALLALALLALRAGLDPRTLPAVALAAIGGVLAYWGGFYALVMDPDERSLVRGLATRAR